MTHAEAAPPGASAATDLASARPTEQADGGAVLVRLLPVAALALPLAILLLGAWLTWQSTWRDASAELVRTADANAEYGARVLAGYALATARINDLVRGLTDAQIVARERELHTALNALVTEVPQAEASYIVDHEGTPLLAASLFPVPRTQATASDRDFFRVLSSLNPPDVHISQVYVSRFDGKPFFAVSRQRRHTGNGRLPGAFDGVVNISVDPRLLAAGMQRLQGMTPGILALVREDGAILARTQGPEGLLPPIQPGSRFHDLARAGGRDAVFTGRNSVESAESLIALRRVEGFPVYAAAMRPRPDIVGTWRATMSGHLVFGMPATLALFLLSLQVKRNHGRMQAANAALEGRVLRRTAELSELSEALDLSATMLLDQDGTIRHWSRGCEGLYGHTRAAAEGQRVQVLLRTEYVVGQRAEALATLQRTGAWTGELRNHTRDGRTLLVLAQWTMQPVPGGAAARRVVVNHTDVSALRQAERALLESEARLRMAQQAAQLGIWDHDLVADTRTWDARMLELWGLPPGTEVTPAMAEAAVHPDDRAARSAALARSRDPAGDGLLVLEHRVIAPGTGDERWVAVNGRTRFEDGRPVRCLGTARDVTERRRAEERNTLLMREVDHRAKNALQVVQAALRLTRAPDQAAYLHAVEGRVAALARALSMLAQRRWEGAELRELLEGELAPFRNAAVAADLEGPRVLVDAHQAQPLCMALHELATNAVKYGALSTPGGRVQVRWHVAGGRLHLGWREVGGPAMSGPPAGRGFGSRVIEQTIQGQLGGRVERQWLPDGLACTITLPLAGRDEPCDGAELAAE